MGRMKAVVKEGPKVVGKAISYAVQKVSLARKSRRTARLYRKVFKKLDNGKECNDDIGKAMTKGLDGALGVGKSHRSLKSAVRTFRAEWNKRKPAPEGAQA